MALISPEYLQTKTYGAKRDRLTLQHGGPVQPGVWDATDFKVVQRASGAGMAVDVGAGFALVGGTSTGNKGYYHVENDASLTNQPVAASHATLPRIDSVYLTVQDTTDGTGPSDQAIINIVSGTAASGTTLDSRAGAATPPANSILLADLLIPAASSSVTSANIRDRRPWARGAFRQIQRNSNAGGGNDFTTTSTSPVLIDNTVLNPRLECSGVPLRITISGTISNISSPTSAVLAPTLDSITDTARNRQFDVFSSTTVINTAFSMTFLTSSITPGSHKVAAAYGTSALGGSGTVRLLARPGSYDLELIVEELLRPNAENT